MPRNRENYRRWHREAVAKKRAAWLAGKSCEFCGSRETLEVDHLVPQLKVDHKVWSWAPARRDAELAKCRVLCRLCHTGRHTLMQTKPLEHGTINGYKRKKCRCPDCKSAKRLSSLVYRRRKKMGL